ncbi:MAG: TonB-dependent receptor [Verrucomicrobiota bacterium]
MKRNFLSVGLVALVLTASAVSAQETNEVEQLRKELREMRERMQAMEQKFDSAGQKPAALATAPATAPAVTTAVPDPSSQAGRLWQPSDPVRLGKGGSYMDIGMVATFAAGGSTAKDIEGGTQLGGHDPNQNGFTVQGAELNLQGAVDTYFRGNANILFSVDAEGESFVELEEAWLETVSLPGNFQIRAGQILSDFGRINTKHPHSWGFVDSPLVNARFLGADGLRNPGARISWLAPTPFYSELMLGIQDSHGETASSFRSSGHSHGDEPEGLPFGYRHPDNNRGVRHVTDLLFTPRYALSFDLTDSQTLVVGASGAFGPNSSGSGGDTMTQIYGVDLYWKWKPDNAHGGFPFVSFQTEAMVRRYELGAFDWDEGGNLGDGDGNGFVDEGVVTDATGLTPAVLNSETVTDYGFYSELLYGFRKGWVAGLRYDYVTGEPADYERAGLLLADNAGGGTLLGRDPQRDLRWRLSPNLTWYPSEFSKVRLQYNYDDRRGFGDDHSVWLQFEFLLGAHAAHKF